MLDFSPAETSLTVEHYQTWANETNVISGKPVTLMLLGLFGEVGSLVSELKKKQRDEDAYIGFRDSVLEELGDTLWYLANLSTHLGLSLEGLLRSSFQDHLPAGSLLTFSSIQDAVGGNPPTQSHLELTLLKLSDEVGQVMAEFLRSGFIEKDRITSRLTEVFKTLIEVATQAQVDLAHAAHLNLKKVHDRWPVEKKYPPCFDTTYHEDEQIPRRIEMLISERTIGGQTYVYQKCNGINIGDRITDNKQEEDDYRFHDVFHLGYAAVLGWSPVIRGLFRVKRKSNPRVDENEDGARATITEEAVSAWIFNIAARLNYFEGLKSLDYGLLKAVRNLVRGYEVHTCPLWLWEEAILQGYTVFRQLREHRRGLVIADLVTKTVEYRKE